MPRRCVAFPFAPFFFFFLLLSLSRVWSDKISENRQDLDAALKVSCEELIAHLSHTLTAPLRTFLDRCTAFLSSPSAKAGDLVAQEWASPNEVLQLHANFRDTVRTQTGSVVKRMRVFLVDDKTVGVLVPPLWVRLLIALCVPFFFL